MLPIMSSMRVRLLIAATVSATTIAAVGATVVWADSVATNGGASQIMSTTATLNGTVHTTDPSPADSAWYFRYGTTTAYGATTKLNVIGPQNGAVSVQITGLEPGTRYHFQLVVAQDINYNPAYSLSNDGSFTTATATGPGGGKRGGGGGGGGGFGTASLKGSRLKVKRGRVSVRLRCAGAAGATCKGKVAISARGKLGGHVKTVRCGSGTFSGSGGHTATVKGKLSSGCKTLLHNARHHQLGATLRVTFSTHQSALRKHVTLVG
jgi:hypothetical protein